MSDLGFHVSTNDGAPAPKAGFSLLQTLAQASQPSGFRPDARFMGASEAVHAPVPVNEVAVVEEPASDPIADAFTQGFTAGYEQALADAAEQARIDAAAREKLTLSFERLDAVLEEELRQRLRETVEALCATAVAPLAIDTDALVRRVERAVSMLARADDERVIRLHPEDIDMISERLAADWVVEPDASLERGAVRVETSQGGVEDGPPIWALAIAEALQRC